MEILVMTMEILVMTIVFGESLSSPMFSLLVKELIPAVTNRNG